MLVHLVFKIVLKRPNELINGQEKNIANQFAKSCEMSLSLNLFWPSLSQDSFFSLNMTVYFPTLAAHLLALPNFGAKILNYEESYPLKTGIHFSSRNTVA